jgi:hypothetical protein
MRNVCVFLACICVYKDRDEDYYWLSFVKATGEIQGSIISIYRQEYTGYFFDFIKVFLIHISLRFFIIHTNL